jgi:LuxR family maltose regulon positive regulatory protein
VTRWARTTWLERVLTDGSYNRLPGRVITMGPLLETKLHVPRPGRALIARPRLSEALSRGAESGLTLVSAPAGFGETTLLARWLAGAPRDGRSVAWLALDQRDNDPTLFWTYLVAALNTAAPGVGATALSLLRPPRPPIDTVLTTLLNDLDALPDDVVLVLDDYHVIDARLAGRDGVPAGAPRTSTVRWDSRSPHRTSPHWRAAPKGGSPHSWGRRSRCRGGTTSRRSSPASPGTTGTSSTTSSRRSSRASPNPSGRFLLRSSILSRLSGPLCDAVTGQGGGKARLVALERANLFLVPLDDRRLWYRYHLLAGVLQAHLQDEEPDIVPDGPAGPDECPGGRPPSSTTFPRLCASASTRPPRPERHVLSVTAPS